MKNNLNSKTKKIIIVALIAVILVGITGFAIYKNFNNKEINEVKETEIKSICELATLKAYYHNVAKDTKDKSTGISGWGEKDREFWIEYEGHATIGIDMEKVSMVLKDEHITITMPHAKVLDTNISTSDEDMRIIESSDGFFNKNKITTEDRQTAVTEAQKDMKKAVENNKTLLQSAELRAQELIENYIIELGDISNIEYQIEWKYIEEN